MIIMDRKGGSWVGDFYHRFEAMCLEVEEVIYEVRTVGDTVKKFYSEVMEDLRSPSSLDSVKDEDIPLNDDVKTCKKENADDGTEPIDAASEKEVKKRDGSAAYNGNKSHRCCSAAIYRVIKPCEPQTVTVPTEVDSRSNNTESISLNQITAVEENPDCSEDSQNKCVSNDSESTSLHQITAAEEELVCREDLQKNYNSNSESMYSSVSDNSDELPNSEIEEPSSAHGDASVKEAFEVSHNEDGMCISREMVEGYECGEAVKEHKTDMLSGENLSSDFCISSIKDDLSTTSTSNVKNSIADEELSIIDLGASSPSHSWEGRNNDADKLGASFGEPFDKFNLEGSCVLVENYGHSSKSALSQIQKSYKKRIQEAFSRRKWSKSKRNQEVLDAWYEEQFANLMSSSAIMQVERQKLKISESFESDWELL